MSRRSFSRLVLLSALLVMLVGFEGSASGSGDWDYKDELVYSDLVVVGIIRDLTPELVPVQEFMPGDPRENVSFRITTARLEIGEVLRGSFEKRTMSVVIPGGHPGDRVGLAHLSYNYEIGDTVILSLMFWEFMKGGSFILRSDKGRYLKQGDRWVNQAQENISLTMKDVRMVVRAAHPTMLLEKADVVGIGRVSSIESVEMDGVEVDRITVQLSTTWKGGLEGKRLTFRIARRGGLALDWWRPVPEVVAIGEEWIIFLKKDSKGYYPFAGTNGLLKVEGQDLILNDRVRHEMSKADFVSLISVEEN